MMKKYWLLGILGMMCYSCHDVPVGYLEAENAVYVPDSLVVRRELDPVLDYTRMLYEADWVSSAIQGVIGTAPNLLPDYGCVYRRRRGRRTGKSYMYGERWGSVYDSLRA